MESKKSMKVKKAKQLRQVKGQSNRRSQGQIKRTNGFKKAKEEVKSFQGVSTSTEKPKKRKVNKTEKRNKIMAQKLAAWNIFSRVYLTFFALQSVHSLKPRWLMRQSRRLRRNRKKWLFWRKLKEPHVGRLEIISGPAGTKVAIKFIKKPWMNIWNLCLFLRGQGSMWSTERDL